MQTLAYKEVSNIFVLVHGTEDPADAEWDAYVAALVARLSGGVPVRALVVTPGVGPSMGQRGRLNRAIDGRALPTAVLTGSTLGRTLVSLIGLRHPDIRAFELSGLDEAFAHLKLAQLETVKVRRVINELRQDVGLPLLA